MWIRIKYNLFYIYKENPYKTILYARLRTHSVLNKRTRFKLIIRTRHIIRTTRDLVLVAVIVYVVGPSTRRKRPIDIVSASSAATPAECDPNPADSRHVFRVRSFGIRVCDKPGVFDRFSGQNRFKTDAHVCNRRENRVRSSPPTSKYSRSC